MSKTTKTTANRVSQALEHYNDTIGQEALQRAGNNPQLKGVVHELLFRDKLNLNVQNRIQGKTAVLTRNPHAHDVDLVVMGKEGQVTGRYQVKDCTSPSGIQDTLNKTRNGRYRSTRLVGTEETTAQYNRRAQPGDKPMESTGVSSKRTGRIADNAGVGTRDKNQFLHNVQDIGSCAVNSAAIGAGIGMITSAVSGYDRYRRGEIDAAEYAGEVAIQTGKSAVSAGATTCAALLLKEGGKEVAKSVGSQTLRRLAGSNAATVVAFGAVEVACDVSKFARGEISGRELGKKTVTTAGGAAGGYGGASVGAAIGTALLPGVGTAVGGFIGGLVGGLGGSSLCSWLFD